MKHQFATDIYKIDPKIEATAAEFEITPKQAQALECLLSGESISTTAIVVEVHRTTIHRWLARDPNFRLAYQTMTADLRLAASCRISTLVMNAVESINRSLEKGNDRLAWKILEKYGSGILEEIAQPPGNITLETPNKPHVSDKLPAQPQPEEKPEVVEEPPPVEPNMVAEAKAAGEPAGPDEEGEVVVPDAPGTANEPPVAKPNEAPRRDGPNTSWSPSSRCTPPARRGGGTPIR